MARPYAFRFRVLSRRPSRVLLVEGDHATAEMYRLSLLMRGYGVDLARDGEEGIDRVLRGDLPDIVILDLGLPRADHDAGRRDSFDMLSALRSTHLTYTVPVLALVSDKFSAHDALDRGATECMVNLRTTPGDLNRKVAELLGERAGSQPGAAAGRRAT